MTKSMQLHHVGREPVDRQVSVWPTVAIDWFVCVTSGFIH